MVTNGLNEHGRKFRPTVTRFRSCPSWTTLLFSIALVSFAGNAMSANGVASATDKFIRFEHAEFSGAESATPPSGPWEIVKLPDFWRHRIASRSHAGWYRFKVDISHWNKSEVAVYLPRFSPNVTVWGGGTELARSSALGSELEQHPRTPLFVKVPQALIAGDVLDVYVQADWVATRATVLGYVYIGDAKALFPSYFWRHILQIEGQLAIAFMIAALGLIAFSIWLADLKDPAFLSYAIAGLLWPIACTELLLTVSPINQALLTHLNSFILAVMVAAFAVFMLELTGRRSRRADRLLLGYMAIAVIGGPLLYEESIPVIYSLVIDVMVLLLGGFVLWVVVAEYMRTRDRLYFALLLTCLASLLLGVHGALAGWAPSFYMHSELMAYGGLPMMACLGWALLRRYSVAKATATSAQEEKVLLDGQRERLRTIGHEIRSPLQSLLSIHATEGDNSRRYVKRMQTAVETLFGAASPDRAFSEMQLENEPIDLSSFLIAYVDGVSQRVGGIKLEVLERPLMSLVDSARLEDALDNLIANASRFRFPDSTINVTATRVGHIIQLIVLNDGPQIDITRLEQIFAYGESSDKESGEHQGLGLFVVKTHVTRMHGQVVARNTANGVEFVITVPAATQL